MNNIYKYPTSGKFSRKQIIIASILLGIIVAAIIAAGIYVKVIEANEIGGYSFIYLKNLTYDVISFAGIFVLMSIMLVTTVFFIKRNIAGHLRENEIESKKFPNLPVALSVALIAAFLNVGIFTSKILQMINSVPFGKTDTIFGKDLGYYIFQRPFIMELYNFIYGAWIFVILFTISYYILAFFSVFKTFTFEDFKLKPIVRHNLINIAILFIIKAFSYFFIKENILYSTFSSTLNLKGAGYVDEKVWLTYYNIAPFLLVIIVIAAFIFISRSKFKAATIAILVFPAVWILTSITGAFINGVIVSPNEFNYQKTYIQANMRETRDAYNISAAVNVKFPDLQDLTPETFTRNAGLKDSIRIVDFKPTLDSDTQLQSIKNFYTFKDGDIIDYDINGAKTPIFISAREIDMNKLPDLSYISTTFKYTHGYGVVINPINAITREGQVQFIMSGLNMNSTDSTLKVTQPRIYYGELTGNHVIVQANGLNEIDFDGSTEMRYDGSGGIKMNFLNKLIYAFKYGDIKFLISNYISADSKLLLNRNIIERVQMIAPFLHVDSDPYMIVTDEGRLKWVIDAYTFTDKYPYSQEMSFDGAFLEPFNYIRNSVKVVADAYDGTVDFYIVDKTDPIVMTYDRMYPGLFSKNELPEYVRLHSRYPEYLFTKQTEILRRYHLDPDDSTNNSENISTFYTNQDLWDIAMYIKNTSGSTDSQLSNIDPYYNMMSLPENLSSAPELILMRPFTPSTRDNMISWLAVRNSYENYGQMILFNFQKNTNIYGPNQIEKKINQIDTVSKDMTLWGQSGSNVYKGSLLVLPFENSILYVEPIYIQATGTTSIPEVREIVVGFQKGDEFRYGVGVNLDDALSNLFGQNITTPAGGTNTTPSGTIDQALIDQLLSKYSDLKTRLDELGALIDSLNK